MIVKFSNKLNDRRIYLGQKLLTRNSSDENLYFFWCERIKVFTTQNPLAKILLPKIRENTEMFLIPR